MKQITAKLDKKTGAGDSFLSSEERTLRDLGGEIAGTISARYFKGIGADGDNVVIELYVSETHQAIRAASVTKSTHHME